MSSNVTAIAKGNLPIITTAAGASVSGLLKYLELINSVAGVVALFVTILGGYWMYRSKRSESLKYDAETERIKLENEQIRLENHEKQVQLEAVEIEQRLEKTAIILIEKFSNKFGNEK
jgi:Na+/H+ antiporter NhaD/arsenite permease-like protein